MNCSGSATLGEENKGHQVLTPCIPARHTVPEVYQ